MQELATRGFDGAGVRLAADEAGPTNAPTVVLLHGGGQTRDSWRRTQARLVASGLHTLSLDLRGHGDSDRAPDRDYRPERFVDDLAEVVAQLPRPVAVVGASLGGVTALAAAADDPAAFWGLVLVDIATRIEPSGVERIVGFMRANPEGFASLDDAADAVAGYLPHRADAVRTAKGFARNLDRGADGRYRWHWDPDVIDGPLPITTGMAQEWTDRLEGAARRISTPTLLVRGGRSDLLSPDGVDEFRTLVPHAEFAEIAGATHMIVGDDNDPFSTAVVHFLSRHRPDPGGRASVSGER